MCVLERYRFTHEDYAESLHCLVPQFVEILPRDVISGQPLQCRRANEEQFLLYSAGWNEADDGGQIVLSEKGNADRDKGDWVWPMLAK